MAMGRFLLSIAAAIGAREGTPRAREKPEKLASAYAEAIEKLNAEHARAPEGNEEELAKQVPPKALRALDELLACEAGEDPGDALVRAGEAALELARIPDFERVHERLETIDSARAAELGTALVRPRFLLRGMGGLDPRYLEHFAAVLDAVLDAYAEVFAFDEFSKVPGKKLRVRIHLEKEITQPPHFAPQFAWHSEIDFPVVDAEKLRSPTSDGKFLLYGLCHELGHVVAMWGDTSSQEDHHSWAHYTGVTVVEHLAEGQAREGLDEARDVRWRSLSKERERLADTPASRADADGVLSLLVRLHDELGPRAIGDALDHLERSGQLTRVNRVRYYRFDDLREALVEGVEGTSKKKRVKELFPDS